MKLEHEQTKTEIKTILTHVQSIAQKATSFNNQKGNMLKSNVYSQDAKNQYIHQLTLKFKENRRADEQYIAQHLDRIAELECANEQIYNFADEDLQGAIALINATKGKLSLDARKNIVDGFKGYKQALLMLHDVFTGYEMDVKYLEKFILDVGDVIESIKTDLELMPENVAEYAGQLQHICDRLFNLAEYLGIELTDSEKNTQLDLSEYYNSLVRGSMGL